MEKIRIMCDAASDIMPDEARELGITLLPATLSYDGINCNEGDISKEDYLQVLLTCKEVPTTGQVTPEKCLAAFRQAMEDGITHVLVVAISSTGSGFWNNAFMARKLFEEEYGAGKLHFCIIDSLSYSYCYGGPIRKAAQMVLDGVPHGEIVDYLKDVLARCEAVAGVYSLRFAKKSGRISGASALVGEVLGVRPVVHLSNGKVEIIAKARGDAALIPSIIAEVKKRADNIKNQDIVLLRGILTDAQTDRLVSLVEKELSPRSYSFGTIGASIATNTGPQMCGVCYLGKKRDREYITE